MRVDKRLAGLLVITPTRAKGEKIKTGEEVTPLALMT
jgi:hypothetical protein